MLRILKSFAVIELALECLDLGLEFLLGLNVS